MNAKAIVPTSGLLIATLLMLAVWPMVMTKPEVVADAATQIESAIAALQLSPDDEALAQDLNGQIGTSHSVGKLGILNIVMISLPVYCQIHMRLWWGWHDGNQVQRSEFEEEFKNEKGPCRFIDYYLAAMRLIAKALKVVPPSWFGQEAIRSIKEEVLAQIQTLGITIPNNLP